MAHVLNRIYGRRSGSVLGRDEETGRMIYLHEQQRSTYIVGTPGMGKSTLLENLILDDIALNDKGIVLFDPHADFAKEVVRKCPPEQAHRVVYFAPAEQNQRVLGFNPFQFLDEREKELKIGALMQVFAHCWYGSFKQAPTLQTTLEMLIRTLVHGYSEYKTNFLHFLQLTNTDESGKIWRRKLAKTIPNNPALVQIWREWENEKQFKQDLSSTRNKVKHIIGNDVLLSILGQPTSAPCFQFQEVLSNKGVLVINLDGLDDEGQRLVGSLILGQLMVMAKMRKNKSDRIPCHIYADEFYKINPESFVEVINETRKYKMFCTFAHQNLEQLKRTSKAAASGCGNVIVFRTNPDDSGTLRKHFSANDKLLPSTYLSNLPPFRAMVRYSQKEQRPQSLIKTIDSKREPNLNVAKQIWKQSLVLGRPLSEIQAYQNGIINFEDARIKPTKRKSIPLREPRKA